MFDHVVIPVDLAHDGASAATHAVRLASRGGIPAELLTVAPAHRYMDVATELKRLAEEVGVSAWTVIETDEDPAEVLFDEVTNRAGALWVIGSHARTSLGELVLGSLSEDLVRDAERPLIVVGPHARDPRDAKVLAVAVDGSPESELVIPAALDVAAQFHLDIRLLQVGAPTGGDSDVVETGYLSRLAALMPWPGCRDYDVLHGKDVAKALSDYVLAHQEVRVIAMATHGVPGGLARVVAGSTTFETLRRAEVPVLAVHPHRVEERPDQEDRERSVVVGIDTVRESAEALTWAADEAERRGLPLTVVHTWVYPVYAAGPYVYPVGPEVDEVRSSAQHDLDEAFAMVRGRHPALRTIGVLSEDTPGHGLVERSDGAELLVVGSHHHGRVAELLGLSVGASCVAKARCPLVIVPCTRRSGHAAASPPAPVGVPV